MPIRRHDLDPNASCYLIVDAIDSKKDKCGSHALRPCSCPMLTPMSHHDAHDVQRSSCLFLENLLATENNLAVIFLYGLIILNQFVLSPFLL